MLGYFTVYINISNFFCILGISSMTCKTLALYHETKCYSSLKISISYLSKKKSEKNHQSNRIITSKK